ncbi:hypothetical protein C1909_09980 [Listeria ivanovii]|uniref:Uncharacterized protein n=1 Tax=Listeria ivanovii (strain ATCC BAA-678 / PAM 55) TaxID=881621 RepID=G2Z882_LISIP|nr:hypothetical protein [Listeria ivanovii]MBK3914743.1 hypothetical protein [Listeria ivanovii subsp. ivanovii]MBK3922097.1 hypothetical protein [Listeria ivanovii subsp. ivanovii]MBK3927032.1 hypothetical protein [Listeria ivanovii subsp. ivanovii]MCJ1718015.1 hypothetical protein [Listeria ivanovii]MCJ1723207.1 hypothetical protein [Listeria ivanovii]
MTKTKVGIFIALAVITLLFFLVPKGVKYIKNQDPELLNAAESVKLQSGEYTVGKDIKVGIYDMQVTKGSLSYFGTKLSKGNKLVGMELLDDNKIYFEGSGEIELTPAEFTPIKPSDDIYTIEHSGSYEIGKQIPVGEYSLTYIADKNSSEKPFIQISPSYADDARVDIQFENKDTYDITLKSGEILTVKKTKSEELDNMDVLLEKK